jgi:glycosyltransferase involved in cell wall biosynthesis
MNITVILCTYNRCRILEGTLQSIAASTLPNFLEWEVLVVDNNSHDQTRAVVENFIRQYPARFRYLFEPRPGKSNALNAGVREARGDVLAFTDDDVTFEPTWLQNLTSALHDGEWAGAGGRTVLRWPPSVPRWLATEGPYSRHGFGGFDQGREAKQLDGPPFGANMAFRKEMFAKYGGFRTDLGPSPTREIPTPGEDTEFGRRLISGGQRLRYEPSAVLYHPVPENELNKRHFLNWWYDNGRASARQFQVQPAREFGRLVAWTLRWMIATDSRVRFYRKLIVWEKVGLLVELCRQGASRRKMEVEQPVVENQKPVVKT